MSISPGSLLGYNGQESFLVLGPPGHLNSAQESKGKEAKLVHEWVHGAIEMKTALQLSLFVSVAFLCAKGNSIQSAPFRNFELIRQESIHFIPICFCSDLGIFL